jgi:predicted MFS family arabinose efflux permease
MSTSSATGEPLKRHVEIKAPILYITTLFQSTGASLLWPITTLYMHNELGESMTVAGAVLMAMSIFMMAGSWVGGRLFDHWNPYKAIVLSVSVSLAALGALTIWHGWPQFAIFMMVLGFADGGIYTLLNSYAATITKVDSRKVFNFQYLFMNVGVVIGTALVGFLFDLGVRYVFGLATLMYLGFLSIVVTNFNVDGLARQAAKAADRAAKSTFKYPKVLYSLLGFVFAMYMGYVLWETVVATHMTSLGMTTQDYSFLWTLNGIVIIFGGLLLDRIIDHLSFKLSVLGGGFLFALSFLFLIYADSYLGFVLTFMLLTVGEMFASPQVPAWIDSIGNPNAKGQAQGLVAMSTSLGRAVGPMYGGLLIDAGSYKLLFSSIFAIMIVFIISTWLLSFRKKMHG